MKTHLLKKLRNRGRNIIEILSVTTTTEFGRPYISGMSYSYSGKEYSDLFILGDSEEDVKNKAERVYLNTNIDLIRKRYRKYRRLWKLNKE